MLPRVALCALALSLSACETPCQQFARNYGECLEAVGVDQIPQLELSDRYCEENGEYFDGPYFRCAADAIEGACDSVGSFLDAVGEIAQCEV